MDEFCPNFHQPISLTSGPIISGTTHRQLRLGERPSKGECSSADAHRPEGVKSELRFEPNVVGNDGQERKRKLENEVTTKVTRASSNKKQRTQASGTGHASARASRKSTVSGKKTGPVQIRDLVEGDIIKPGKDKVTVQYKGVTYTAALAKDGTILYEGRRFHAASAFSVHVKRLLTPNKQGDDGWKSVHVDGRPLEEWRAEYYAKQKLKHSKAVKNGESFASNASNAHRWDQKQERIGRKANRHSSRQDEVVETSAAGYENGGGELATDQWVQCSRCDEWRVVPIEYWEQVQSDTRDEWYCKDAEWDITAFHPFTKGCVFR